LSGVALSSEVSSSDLGVLGVGSRFDSQAVAFQANLFRV
jgi:hypothetical protein